MKETERKNILLIIPEMCVGGAQRSLASLSVELARQHNVWLAVFNKDNLAPYDIGGELLSLEVFSGSSPLTKLRAFFKRISQLRQIKRDLKINTSISFLEGADYVNILSRQDDKVIISIRGSKYHDEEIAGLTGPLRLRVLMPLLYKSADKIVCVSRGIKDELQQRMGISENKLSIIYNFYDEKDPSTSDVGADKFAEILKHDFIVSVGRLHKQKNFFALLDVFAQVVRRKPDFRLVIIGDGPEREMLINKSQQLGFDTFVDNSGMKTDKQQVFFTGFQKPDAFLKRAKLFVLPSLWEGFPNSLMEALAFGVPALAADCPTGPREILAPEISGSINDKIEYAQWGILLPLLNSEKSRDTWSNAIVDVLSDENVMSSYRTKGPVRFREFSRSRIYPEWAKLL